MRRRRRKKRRYITNKNSVEGIDEHVYIQYTHTYSIQCSKQETIYHACMSKIDRARFCIQHTWVSIWPMNVNMYTLACMHYHVHLPEPVRMSWKLITQHILRLWWSQCVIVYLGKSVKCVCDHIHVWITCLCVHCRSVPVCLSVCLSVSLFVPRASTNMFSRPGRFQTNIST